MSLEAFRAFHLPMAAAGVAPAATGDAGTQPAATEPLERIDAGRLPCLYPRPTPELLARVIGALRDARSALLACPVHDLVNAIATVAARFTDPADPLRQRALRLIPAATGYSGPMTGLILDRMAADWRAGPLLRLLRSELGDPTVLDAFTARGGRRTRAYGPPLSFHVFAGNVPGVAVTSIIRSLLVKSPTFGKTAAGEPVLPVLFAEALAQVHPALANALAVTYWPGGAEDAERPLLQAADLVVVYGGEATVESIRRRAPAHRRIVVHGPRFSVALVGRDALPGGDADARETRRVAHSLARAVAIFDQHGCVSPHAVWVEDPHGPAALELARAIADALQRLEPELPRGEVSPAEASAIQQERGAAELRGHAGAPLEVFASAGTRWTVIYDPDPRFRPSCLNRFIRVHPVRTLDEAMEHLSPAARHLQSVAIEGAGSRLESLADRLARLGATRVTTADQLPWPSADWHHDGSGPLTELLRWVDLEG